MAEYKRLVARVEVECQIASQICVPKGQCHVTNMTLTDGHVYL